MGSSVSRTLDSYDDYVWFCKKVNVEPKGIYDEFEDHMYLLLKEYPKVTAPAGMYWREVR